MTRLSPIAAIGGAGKAVGAFLGAARADGSRSDRSFAITLLTPIRPDATTELAAEIDALGVGNCSPLAKLGFVHFGRWVIIDQLKTNFPDPPVPQPKLRSEYLLFSACVTGPIDDADPATNGYVKQLPASFLREIWQEIPGTADAIWRHCWNFPGVNDRDAFVRYLAKSQVNTSLFHVGYPQATVEEVRRAIAKRDRFIAFAREHQGEPDPAALQQAYRRESATWDR